MQIELSNLDITRLMTAVIERCDAIQGASHSLKADYLTLYAKLQDARRQHLDAVAALQDTQRALTSLNGCG